MKVGHLAKDCDINKTCVYCGEANVHHRSLCPKKYKANITSTYLSRETDGVSGTNDQIEENVLISSEEIVLMQTATTEIRDTNNSHSTQTRLLLDSGSQRTYILETLAKKLNLKGEKEQEIKLATFGSNKTKLIKTKQQS